MELKLQVSSEEEYQVAVCARHAVLDHHRARIFQQLLQGPLTLPDHLLNLGEVLFQVQPPNTSANRRLSNILYI